MSNVVNLNVLTTLDIPADRVIEATMGKLKRVVILGYDNDGEEYFASSIADGADVVWLMERMKKKLLEIVNE